MPFRKCRLTALFALMLSAGAAGRSAAQSADAQGAWDALMLAPFGALPPHVTSADSAGAHQTLLLRYGRWRYDADDAAHNTFGLTAARRVMLDTEISLTAAYLLLQCGGCSNWYIGGVDVESTVWRHELATGGRRATLKLGVRGGASTARNATNWNARASSLSATLPVGLGFAFGAGSQADIAVFPGVGYGWIAGENRANAGVRPSLGGGLAWRRSNGPGLELGIQRVFVTGGPYQLGVGLTWGRSSRSGPIP